MRTLRPVRDGKSGPWEMFEDPETGERFRVTDMDLATLGSHRETQRQADVARRMMLGGPGVAAAVSCSGEWPPTGGVASRP